ncbi:LysR family transcriptional regulator [Roseateles cellulosilyticus]|uniref:LysR family transcriptional regulator n=1 Tax=Pelomonas cellulosilytica TaxID=2906762 RepID=A0ABS8XZR1_9BURK|nr:LysR family transcriptional regulator [Pelomonas sp. P8]MCE4557483.1 LysR family transcriptional regulator [Pelomonas sp. P8]
MPTSAITLRQLRVLLAVARHGGFGRAGDDIGLSQPAVSQAVRSLEAELGVKLLDRTTREVVLTAAGQSLVAPLQRALDELDGVLDDARGQAAAARGVVDIASAPTISGGLMPQVLAAARERHPAIQVRLRDQVQQLAIEGVRSGAVDFAVLVGMEDDAPDLEQQPLFDERFVLVCPAAHALARRRLVRMADAAGWPLVLLDHSSGSRPLIDRAFARAGVALQAAIDVGHAATAFRMVQAGLGVSVLPALSLPLPDTAGLCAVPMEPALSRQVVLARRRQRSLAPAAQTLWTLVAELAAPRATCP